MNGASAVAMAWFVRAVLRRAGACRDTIPKQLTDERPKAEKTVASELPLAKKAKAVLGSPVLVSLMLCNTLSFFASKCTKEWAAVYLRGTGLAATDLQSANLLFWAEMGASAGAGLSGFASLCLGGRHALTCFVSAIVAVLSTGTLAMKTRRWKGKEFSPSPVPFALACVLQALSLAGINAVRTLAGLHGAEVAERMGMVGMANGCMEVVGQIGSIFAGQPIGALAARVASRDGERAGWSSILATLTMASVGLALLNAGLLPAESQRLALENRKKKAEEKDVE